MFRPLARGYLVVVYYLSWFVFAVGGLALNAVCAVLLPFRRSAACQHSTRSVIRWLFDLWARWFHASRVVDVRWRGFPEELPTGTIYVANHPSLVDAPVLLSRLPDAICIFKPALMRNPAIGPAAIVANYVGGNAAVDVLRQAADRVADGRSLLIFPEGTRTEPGTRMGPWRPGFALIAQRAGAPIQAIRIRTSKGLVRRGDRWWRLPPELPGWIEFTFERCWLPDRSRSAHELAADVQQHFRQTIVEPA